MARPAALAALAAHAQGKFWDYHDKVFSQSSSLSEKKLVDFANELNLDVAKFNLDRNSSQIMKQLNQELRSGQSAGVRGTPAVFINGVNLQNRSLQGASQMVDAELNRLAQ